MFYAEKNNLGFMNINYQKNNRLMINTVNGFKFSACTLVWISVMSVVT